MLDFSFDYYSMKTELNVNLESQMGVISINFRHLVEIILECCFMVEGFEFWMVFD